MEPVDNAEYTKHSRTRRVFVVVFTIAMSRMIESIRCTVGGIATHVCHGVHVLLNTEYR